MEPPFSLTTSKYDTSTFTGRLQSNFDIVDPRTLLLTKSQVEGYVKQLQQYKQDQRASKLTNAELWYARKVKDSAVHPDTGEIIFRPFRMSGFVPYGTPVVLLMLLPSTSQSLLRTVFAQTLNQSHNAAVNWSNRAATKSTDGSSPFLDILRGYTMAVSVAVGISCTAMLMLSKLPRTPRTDLLRMFVPWPAVVCASTSNMVVMRLPELRRGISVFDADTGEDMGTSQQAAQRAIYSTAVARATLATAAVLGPQICYTLSDAAGMYRKFPKLRMPTQAFYTLLCFGLGVPISLSFFTQEVVVPATELEPNFRDRKNSAGTIIKQYRFNKGL